MAFKSCSKVGFGKFWIYWDGILKIYIPIPKLSAGGNKQREREREKRDIARWYGKGEGGI